MKKYQFRGKTEYPAIVKFAYAVGIEKLVVPPSLSQKISRSTISSWRKLNKEEWAQYYDMEMEVLDLLSNIKAGKDSLVSTRMVKKAFRAALTFRYLVGEDRFFRVIRDKKKEVISIVDYSQDVFGLAPVLKFLGISSRQYRDWKIELKFNCEESVNALCVKRHSNQLNNREIRVIENAINDLAYSHWPLSAVHDQLRLEGKIFICRSTFYKYARMLMGGKSRLAHRKPKRKGLRAKATNEVWHIDISVCRTLDGKKCYLYLLVDNYSRYIIYYKVSHLPSNKFIVGNMVVDAFNKIAPDSIVLLSDKGSENRNSFVAELFREFSLATGKRIQHHIAQEDITSSNSMIERVFRIIKGDYLYRQKIENLKCLQQIITGVIYEYNRIRPHHAHPLQTPAQVFQGEEAPDLSGKMRTAQQQRREFNHNCKCTVCTC